MVGEKDRIFVNELYLLKRKSNREKPHVRKVMKTSKKSQKLILNKQKSVMDQQNNISICDRQQTPCIISTKQNKQKKNNGG